MSLVILVLSALWLKSTGMSPSTTTSTGLVTWNVPKISTGLNPTSSSSKDALDLMSFWTSRTNNDSERSKTRHRATLSTNLISSNLNVMMRLQKLNYYFTTLRIPEEDCRHRLLCEVARDPAKFSPLAIAFLDETRFVGDETFLASRLLNTQPGTKLMAYIEATLRGKRRNGCEVYVYRCPTSAESMINYDTLLLWREMSKWLTVKMISRGKTLN